MLDGRWPIIVLLLPGPRVSLEEAHTLHDSLNPSTPAPHPKTQSSSQGPKAPDALMICSKSLNPLKILAKGDSVGDGSGLHFGVVFLRDRGKFGYHELFVGTQV